MNYSRKYMHLLAPAAKLSTILGLTPCYCFKTHKLKYVTAFRCYVSLLTCVVAAASVTAQFWKIKLILRYNFSSVFYVLDFFRETLTVTTFFTTALGIAFKNMNSWQELLHLLYALEAGHNKTRSKYKITENPNFLLLLGSIYFLTLYTTQIILFPLGVVYYTTTISMFYVNFVSSMVIFNILVGIKLKYRNIAVALRGCKVGQGQHKTVEKIGGVYLTLSKIVELFNRIFGWTILGVLCLCIAQNLHCLLFSIADIQAMASSRKKLIIINVFYGLIVWVGPVSIIFTCDQVVQESRKLLVTCYKMEEYFPLNSKVNQELQRLEKLVKNNRPVFSAAGFFQVTRSTLLYILSTITTYFIVTIQLSNT